jgi:hypothetical protein
VDLRRKRNRDRKKKRTEDIRVRCQRKGIGKKVVKVKKRWRVTETNESAGARGVEERRGAALYEQQVMCALSPHRSKMSYLTHHHTALPMHWSRVQMPPVTRL